MLRNRKASLKIKLIASYLVLSLVLVLSLLYFARAAINREFEKYVKENMERESSEIVIQASNIYQHAGAAQAFEGYRRIGEYAVGKGLVLRIEDSQGNQIWCMDCEDPERCTMMLTGMEHNMNRAYQGFSGQYTETYYPVEQDGKRLGAVILGYYGPFYYDNLDLQFLSMLNRLFTIAAVSALAISVGLGLMMAGRISRPVKSVIRQTRQIENGNYDSLITEESNTLELEQLVGSVNALAVTLGKQKELRKRLAQDYAHEFRTPLASLQSSLEAMIDGIWEPTKERLLSLEEELGRLTRMVGDLGTLVEVEDNLILERTRFDLLEIIRVTFHNFESDIHNKQLDVAMAAAEEGAHFEVFADRDKMGQVMVNLLSNAIKYSERGGRIDILVGRIGRSGVRIEVRDIGIGISDADLPHIFEHLYRADRSRNSETGGSGIGLSIVKAIVEAHGGTITAESGEGAGTRFVVAIPG